MEESLLQTLFRTRWVGTILTGGFLALGLSITLSLGGTLPPRPDLSLRAGRASNLVPIEKAQALFAPEVFKDLPKLTNAPDVFYTTYFQPAPKPKPRPPTTKKVNLTYLGFVEGGSGQREAYIQTDAGLVTGPAGTKLIDHFVVSAITLEALTVQADGGTTNVLPFNVKQELEIPVSK